jgi:uncharacterized membrane protein
MNVPNFRFDQPVWLWLLIAAVPLAWIGLMFFVGMSRGRRWVSILLRTTLLGLIAATLAGLASVRTTNKLAVVALVDVSDSVRRWGGITPQGLAAGKPVDVLDRVRAYLDRSTRDRGPEDLLGLVVFDGKAIALATPGHADVLKRSFDVKIADGTNLADAIRLGRALIPPDAAGRLILISDGVATTGDTRAALGEMTRHSGAQGRSVVGALPIDILPIRYDVQEEVVVESVDSPPTAAAGSSVSVRIVLSATAASRGALRLLREGQPLAIGRSGIDPDSTGRRIELAPGRHVEVIEVPLKSGRVHRLRAVFEPDVLSSEGGVTVLAGDTLRDNNSAESFTITPGKGNVLVVDGVSHGQDGSAGLTVVNALREQGVDVTVVGEQEFPSDLLSMEAFDLIMLENVPAESAAPEVQAMLASYVRDLGGGLVMIGGPDSFAPGGWRKTPIEPLLPVRLDMGDRVVSPDVATLFVIDNSGSRGFSTSGTTRSKQEIVNEATALAIAQLEKTDLVGVLVFNARTETIVPLGPNTIPEETERKVRAISPDGGTNMPPALEAALVMMQRSEAKQKQVIVLSDGRSMGRGTLVDHVKRMKEAGIIVSTIGVGDDADNTIMEKMAQEGNGTFYPVLNANVLPKIFLKAIRLARSPRIREGEFTPRVVASGSSLITGLSTFPPLNGLVLTRARLEPTVVNALATSEGEPVLAHWNAGLGRVAAFTSDAHKWGAPWIGWPGYAQFWAQVVRGISRPTSGKGFRGEAEVRDDRLRLRVEARDDKGEPVAMGPMPATVFSESGVSRSVVLSESAPGVYEVSVPLETEFGQETGTFIAVAKPEANGRALSPVIFGATVNSGSELRSLKSDDALLAEIAKATGGRMLDLADPAGARLFDRAGVRPREASTLLTRILMMWTLGVLLLDIASRRIAWDRWTSAEFGIGVARAAAESVRDRGVEAGRAVSGLKKKIETTEKPEVAAPVLTLSEEDAKRLEQAARDRRRAVRMGQVVEARAETPTAPTAVVETPSEVGEQAPRAEESGLMAAKRRARDRMQEGE